MDPGDDHTRECISGIPGLGEVCGECDCWCHLTPADRRAAWVRWTNRQDAQALMEVEPIDRPLVH